ncbi:MAG TPA: competence/damage-inducible protein A [Verrucomicrobiae bacterium]
MVTELVNTGSELMLGRVLNTHQQWLCRELANLGYVVDRQVAVPDAADAIQAAVREALARADLVITTGGLGPTSCDLTRDAVAQLLRRNLNEDPAVLAQITGFFTARNRVMPESTRVQALVPEGALVLDNAFGTAPGLALEVRPNPFRPGGAASWLIMLPGPPRELRPMFTNVVTPLLRRALPIAGPFVCRTLRSTGIGESIVEEKLAGPMRALVARGLELGYCARPGQVDVRLVARVPDAEALVLEGETVVRAQLDPSIYATEDEELEEVAVRLLTQRQQTIALAESCTGGYVANLLTNVPGASAVLLAGLVTYSNDAKRNLLGVRPETLTEHGAVSAAVAQEMAEGARQRAGSTYAISVTGIAGPGGGTPAKPVGTVFMALAGPHPTVVVQQLNPWDRLTFKQATANQALDLLRRNLAA